MFEIRGGKGNLLLKNTLEPDSNPLIDAILKGQIYFQQGKFVGKFNASVSKELKSIGAKWNSKYLTWDIQRAKLNNEIKNAIDVSLSKFQQTAKKIDRKLAEIVPEEIADKVKIEHIFDTAIFKTENEFKKSIKNITVAPQLTAEGRAKLAKEYTENMKLHIRGWVKDEIVELRKKVKKQAFNGFRYDSLISDIQKSYQVSQKKAKFLARQETNLCLMKLKEIRYGDAGITQYKWRCVTGTALHPVRPRHKQLNDESLKGKLFSFDDPPITSEPGKTVRRNNPGEDFGCRCTAIPVVNF
jgi:SPP1 gp7 family putative phage head morphogenesis protein